MRAFLFRLAGPLAGIFAYLALVHLGPSQAAVAGIVLWMAVWWISECVPIAVTALLPLVLYPLFGVQDMQATAAHYGRDIIFLFLGGFLLALGVERSGLHHRFALWTVSRIGASPPRLVLGTLLASGVLSMWINSTAAVLVMLPIALSLLRTTNAGKSMGAVLALAVSYGATIGGMATPVGTPPNLVMLALWKQEFPQEEAIGFGQWMLFGVPYALLFLGVAWLLLTRVLFTLPDAAVMERKALNKQRMALGEPTRDERLAGLVFAFTALLWMTGDDIVFSEAFVIRGWRGLLNLQRMGDPAVGMFGGLVLFLLPAKGEKRALLDWDFAQQRIPWGVVLLIGSGFAIAGGIDTSGLGTTLGQALLGWRAGSDLVQVGAIATGVTLLSELGSNTAVASLVLPILGRTASAWGMAPLMVMVPATLAASCGFMLPIASPMQAIVFASGHLTMKQMVKAGLWMDLAGVLLLILLWAILGAAVFG